VTTVQITDFFAATSKIPAQPDRGIFSVATVDVDGSNGRVYVSYTDRPNTASNDTDIFVRFSDDSGASWSAPIQVNDDATTTSQFLPRMAIDQTTRVVYATWYDARNDAANNQQVDVFISKSLDGALNWSPNQQLTGARSDESTANPARDNGNNYGEYLGLSAHNGVAHAVWTDARAANFIGGTNEDVYTTASFFACFGVPATIIGTTGKDTLVGTLGDDVIVGLGGNDAIDGKGGNDRLCGDEGADIISGGIGDDQIDGGPGDDRINGGPGNDTIFGGAGRDTIAGASGDDTIDGGPDRDRINGGPGTDVCVGEIVAGCEL
jgi:Ca2+-binding RTX toxin-like protein